MFTKFEKFRSLRPKLRNQITLNSIPAIKHLPRNIQRMLPFSPFNHPLAALMQNPLAENKLHLLGLEPDETEIIQQMNESNRFYILEQQSGLLEQFYSEKQKEASPLGNLYKEMNYKEFLNRLISKKFKAIYSDARLMLPRSHDVPFTNAYDQKIEEYQSSGKFLEMIGSAKDDLICKEYLSLEEAAVSPFVVPQAYFLPLSDGTRVSFSQALHLLNLQRGSLFQEWDNAHPYPVAVSYLAAPEFRNCFSLQYDVLACVRFESLQHPAAVHFVERQTLARQQPGFASVISLIYGEENAFSSQNTKHADTITFENPVFGKGVFYINAYKNRLKHNFHQLLQLSNLALGDKGVVTIKGMSLGAFAIQSLLSPMEKIFMETLKEAVTELYLPKIKKINLINFPSSLSKFTNGDDLDYVLSIGHTVDTTKIASHGLDIEMTACIGAPLAKQADTHIATHICGDSLSYPGNEVFAGLPPKISSDDSVMHFAGGCDAMIKGIESKKEEKIYLLSGNRASLFAHKSNGNCSILTKEQLGLQSHDQMKQRH